MLLDEFNDYYMRKIPYTSVTTQSVAELFHVNLLMLENVFDYPYGEYMKPIYNYLQIRKKMVEKDKMLSFLCSEHKVILVSNDMNRIRKTALILSQYDPGTNKMYPEITGLVSVEEVNNLKLNGIYEVDIGRETDSDKKTGNPYITMICSVTKLIESNEKLRLGMLIRGMNAAMIQDQCDAALCSGNSNVFIAMPRELMNEPEVQRLIYEHGFDVLRLPDMDYSYYKNAADEMIKHKGILFENEDEKNAVINAVIQKCGTIISEEMLSMSLTMGIRRMRVEGSTMLQIKHFSDYLSMPPGNARQMLSEKTGLTAFKEAVDELVAVEREARRNPKAVLSSKHMLFEGNPGCGKTLCAEQLAQILAAEGVTRGSFIVASRKDIIGKYVGHTAPKVARLFEKARGGVLFVDEAGFFLNDGSGGFVEEAVKEFVRYMELYKDVTVIFAFYPGEAKQFLELDEGLRSRIARTVCFDDYSDDELFDIFSDMVGEKGYSLGSDVSENVRRYLEETKKQAGKQFGNARECRRLCDGALRAVALRHAGEPENAEYSNLVSSDDIDNAVKTLCSKSRTPGKIRIGF